MNDKLAVPIPDSYWVVPGLLLAGEYPGGAYEIPARLKLHAFLTAGIRVFIDLTEDGGLEPYQSLLAEEAAVLGIQVEYRRVPIRDLGIPTADVARDVVERIQVAIDSGRPVYVHCWGGIGRTGTIIGCWLRREGCAAEAVLARIDALRRGLPGYRRRSPETDEQRRFVETWTWEPAGLDDRSAPQG